MNLILFDPDEAGGQLARSDRRAAHILDVLRRKPGDTFDAGMINGARGVATLTAVNDAYLSFSFAPTTPPATSDPITLIVGLPRPQTARDVLRDATTLGVAAILFVRTEKSDPNYADSTLWKSGDWRRHIIHGAEQAFDTRIPEVNFDKTLNETLPSLVSGSVRIALDNYEGTARLSELEIEPGSHVILAVGGERGWSALDRDMLRAHRFEFANLGKRVLRTESAIIAALSIVRAHLGLM